VDRKLHFRKNQTDYNPTFKDSGHVTLQPTASAIVAPPLAFSTHPIFVVLGFIPSIFHSIFRVTVVPCPCHFRSLNSFLFIVCPLFMSWDGWLTLPPCRNTLVIVLRESQTFLRSRGFYDFPHAIPLSFLLYSASVVAIVILISSFVAVMFVRHFFSFPVHIRCPGSLFSKSPSRPYTDNFITSSESVANCSFSNFCGLVQLCSPSQKGLSLFGRAVKDSLVRPNTFLSPPECRVARFADRIPPPGPLQ